MVQIKIRKENEDGLIKVETSGEIKEVMINEDLLKPNTENVSICFRGSRSSGVIELSPAEIEKLYLSVKNRLHLIKESKRV